MISVFANTPAFGSARYEAKCTGGVVASSRSIQCLAVEIVPRCLSYMEFNLDDILKKPLR